MAVLGVASRAAASAVRMVPHCAARPFGSTPAHDKGMQVTGRPPWYERPETMLMVGVGTTFGTIASAVYMKRQADIAYQQTAECKVATAVDKMLHPYEGTVTMGKEVLERPVMHQIRERIEQWGRGQETQATTIICGLFESGKSFAVPR